MVRELIFHCKECLRELLVTGELPQGVRVVICTNPGCKMYPTNCNGPLQPYHIELQCKQSGA